MRKLIVATVLALTAIHAQAWGDREQGIVAGIAGTLLLQRLTQPQYAPPVYTHPPVVQTPPPYYPGTVYPSYTHRPMYRMVDVYVPECNCYRTVQVQIN